MEGTIHLKLTDEESFSNEELPMREVRLCLEFAKESEFMARRDDRLIFYG